MAPPLELGRGVGPGASDDSSSKTSLAFLQLAARFAPRSWVLSVTRAEVVSLRGMFERGDHEGATQASRMWVGVLEPLVARKRKTLVDQVFKQCANDLRGTIDNGEGSEVRPTLRAGFEFALRVVETGNRAMINSVLEPWVPLLDYALETHGPDTKEIIANLAKRFDLSTDSHKKEARTLTYLVFFVLERALQEGQEKIKVVNCLVQTIQGVPWNYTLEDAACVAWLKELFISGEKVQMHQVMLETATRLLGVTDPEGEKTLIEQTVAKMLGWLLRTAQAADRLGFLTAGIAKLAKNQITSGGGGDWSVVRDKDLVKKVFKVTKDSLSDKDIQEALDSVLHEIH